MLPLYPMYQPAYSCVIRLQHPCAHTQAAATKTVRRSLTPPGDSWHLFGGVRAGKDWQVKYITRGVAKPGGTEQQRIFLGSMSGCEGDPGYWDTSILIVESALCLATQVGCLPLWYWHAG